MNVFFLYEDREWMNIKRYNDAQSIIQDLGLKTLFSISAKEVMRRNKEVVGIGKEDPFLAQTMKTVMMVPLRTQEEIYYRHEMLTDVMEHKDFIYDLYSCVDDMLKKWDDLGRKVNSKLASRDSVAKLIADIHVLQLFVNTLNTIKLLFKKEAETLTAPGFAAFYERLCEEYSDEKQAALEKILGDISFYAEDIATNQKEKTETRPKIVLGCTLTDGLKCSDFVVEDVLTKVRKYRGHNSVVTKVQDYIYAQRPGAILLRKNANVQEQVASMEYEVTKYLVSACVPFMKSLNSFFDQMHFQLGFFKAAINLQHHISRLNLPYCYPKVQSREVLKFADLKEFVMAIEQRVAPVGNTCDISNRMLLIVTGANQGGKSTFLRSVGIAQIMMQCGLPVVAESYESGIFPAFFTHFTRREDSAMNSGRLDEELKRMSQIVDNLGESSMVLLNESFATTTEKEGSVIAYDIIKALTEADVKVLTVTHLLSFAQRMFKESKDTQSTHIEFFCAEREANGKRTFRMIQHEPELTSFGMDLYNSIIGDEN